MTQVDCEQSVTSFFGRLNGMDGLLHALTRDRLSMVMEFRPSGKRVLLDLTTDPLRVETGGADIHGTVSMAAEPEDLHKMLLGEEPPALQLDQRRLLLRGGMEQTSRFFPLIDLTPALYASHLCAPARDKPPSFTQRILGFFAFVAGWFLVLFKSENQIRIMKSAAAGMLRSLAPKNRPPAPLKAGNSLSEAERASPLMSRGPSVFSRLRIGIFRFHAYIGGFVAGFLKHRLKLGFDLFAVLSRLSAGMKRND